MGCGLGEKRDPLGSVVALDHSSRRLRRQVSLRLCRTPGLRSPRHPCCHLGWHLSFVWQKKRFKGRKKGRHTDSAVTSAGLQQHGLLESELDEPD